MPGERQFRDQGGATVISRDISSAGGESPRPVAPMNRLLFIAETAAADGGALFRGREVLVATAGQATPLGSLAWSGLTASMADFFRLDRAAAEVSGRVAEEGAGIATEAGLHASPVAVEAAGPVWTAIVETADRHDAAMIVMGSRGLTGLRSTLLGSVSSAVVHHTDRPTLLVRQPIAG